MGNAYFIFFLENLKKKKQNHFVIREVNFEIIFRFYVADWDTLFWCSVSGRGCYIEGNRPFEIQQEVGVIFDSLLHYTEVLMSP